MEIPQEIRFFIQVILPFISAFFAAPILIGIAGTVLIPLYNAVERIPPLWLFLRIVSAIVLSFIAVWLGVLMFTQIPWWNPKPQVGWWLVLLVFIAMSITNPTGIMPHGETSKAFRAMWTIGQVIGVVLAALWFLGFFEGKDLMRPELWRLSQS